MSDDDEVMQEFLVQSHQLLEHLDRVFVVLEGDPGNRDVLAAAFRTVHTIKGTAGLLGFSNLSELCQKTESLLGLLRDGEVDLTVPMTDVLLRAVDRLGRFQAVIEKTGADDGVPTRDLVAELTELTESSGPAGTSTLSGASRHGHGPIDGGEAPAGGSDDPVDGTGIEDRTAIGSGSAGSVVAPNAGHGGPRIGDILVTRHEVDRTDVEIAAAEQAMGDPRLIGQILADAGRVGPNTIEAAVRRQATGRLGAADPMIRVDVTLLDDLMNLVGELVLTGNEILQYVADSGPTALATPTQRLDVLMSELQDKVMGTGMQPIGGLWNKLPPMVRELAHQCGRQVRLEVEGQATELDTSLVGAIEDSLTHLVRNSVDHGIEVPAVRARQGKSEEGVLSLSAAHQDGQVIVTVADDGAGIDVERIRSAAVESGLLTAVEAETISDADAVQLIFQPGFSTSEEVTSLSGRGVGMDVVRTNIERVGGSISVETEVGVGTSFRLEIPLTLAIVPALIVASGPDRYAVPQRSLVGLAGIGPGEAGHRVEFVHDAPVVRFRERLLPMLDLRQIVDGGNHDPPVGDMVVLSADGFEFAMLVEGIVETKEIVVKPLSQVVSTIDLFSGATILGDGQVALILDVTSLGRRARLRGPATETGRSLDSSAVPATATMAEPLLVVALGDGRRVAMALPDVKRLDEFAVDGLEPAGRRQVVQYRSDILPLIDLGLELGYESSTPSRDAGTVNVVVYRHRGRDVGLVIDEMIDIVDHPLGAGIEPGDSLVIGGRVTELIDLAGLPSLDAIEHEFPARGVGVDRVAGKGKER